MEDLLNKNNVEFYNQIKGENPSFFTDLSKGQDPDYFILSCSYTRIEV
ncbi:hypothetical protein [Evansella tamaricis]|uniref:Carbonic anhydrase n=1 Tax=Evansella tamaricis TaxID=2069301 RepID=A0ABS6JKS9_9BACI|nr:hypothetical protein [Evansella tamaricis]MBU9714191.1 hypothetical protein [Evansella tamaricis]